jgi:hypothetical protein
MEVFQPMRVAYRLETGEEIDGRTIGGWCNRCDGYQRIECLDVMKVKEELGDKQRRHRVRHFLAKVLGINDAPEVQELQGLLNVLKKRTAQPRCLRCWSEDTAPLVVDGRPLKHKCGGNLEFGPQAGVRFNFGRDIQWFILNSEGQLLDEQVRPCELATLRLKTNENGKRLFGLL